MRNLLTILVLDLLAWSFLAGAVFGLVWLAMIGV